MYILISKLLNSVVILQILIVIKILNHTLFNISISLKNDLSHDHKQHLNPYFY